MNTMRRLSIKSLLLVLLWVFVGGACSSRHEQRSPPTNVRSVHRLKQIGAALHVYHRSHGEFPPATVNDANGNPVHSWRVLLLPVLGHEGLYRKYDFSEPWDSPNNMRLIRNMPRTYGTSTSGRTSFLAVVGEAAAWGQGAGRKKADFEDDLDNTVIVLELKSRSVLWTSPDDCPLPWIETRAGIKSLNNEDVFVNALFADGSIRKLNLSRSHGDLLPVFTRAGRETVDQTLFQEVIP